MSLNGILRPKLVSIPLASRFLINLDFLVPDKAHFDTTIVLLFLVFDTLGFMPFVFFLHFS